MEPDLKKKLQARLDEITYYHKMKYMQTLRYILLVLSVVLLFIGIFFHIGNDASHIAAVLVLLSVVIQIMKFEFEKDVKNILEALLTTDNKQ